MMAGPVLARSDWSEVHPSWTALVIPTAEAFQHHTGGDGPGTDLIGYLRGLEYGEMNRGDGLIALAYHWMVVSGGPHDGTKCEVRPWGMQGGATLNHNAVSHAVCMTGNFQTAVPTEAAMDSCAEVWAEGMRRGFVSVAAMIQPHSAVFATACPGTNLRALLPELRTRIDKKLSPTPIPTPAPTEVDVLTFPCPGFPDIDGNHAHAEFDSDVAPHGGLRLRWGARIEHDLPVDAAHPHSHTWGPPLRTDNGATKWESAYERGDNTGMVLVDDKGGTTTSNQGLFVLPH